MKLNFSITNTFEIDFTITPKADYIRRTGDYDMADADPDDWYWDVHDLVCLETGCPVDEAILDDEQKAALIKQYLDAHDPTP